MPTRDTLIQNLRDTGYAVVPTPGGYIIAEYEHQIAPQGDLNYALAPVTTAPRTTTGEISALVASARSGDTINLRPGTYYDGNFLKDGVTFQAPEGKVTLINNRVDMPMLSDEATIGTGGDVVCDFIGPFEFVDQQTPATSGRNHGIIQITRAGSRIRLFDIIGMSSETANTTGNPCCIFCTGGLVECHGAGTLLQSIKYDCVIMKGTQGTPGTGTVRLNVDRLLAATDGLGADGNALEIGYGNTIFCKANLATSDSSKAMRLNGTCDIDVFQISGKTGGIITATGCVSRVRALEIKATGSDIATYAVQHGAGTLAVDARRVVSTATNDIAVIVLASGLTMMNATVVVGSGATDSIGGGEDPFNVMFNACYSNKGLGGLITALIASNYTVDTDIV